VVVSYRLKVPTVRAISALELDRIHEVDVSEEGLAIFLQVGSRLERAELTHSRPRLTEEDWSEEKLLWQGFVREGGCAFGALGALGALEGDLVGFAVMRARLTEDTDQLAALYVDRRVRRTGVGSMLVERVVEVARTGGARKLYVSATRSESAVLFYLDQGFAPVAEPHPDLFDLEPKDIHMSLALDAG
jgi:GNAT superfamily N-acetyltransferase